MVILPLVHSSAGSGFMVSLHRAAKIIYASCVLGADNTWESELLPTAVPHSTGRCCCNDISTSALAQQFSGHQVHCHHTSSLYKQASFARGYVVGLTACHCARQVTWDFCTAHTARMGRMGNRTAGQQSFKAFIQIQRLRPDLQSSGLRWVLGRGRTG